jgi:hypothetical protein
MPCVSDTDRKNPPKIGSIVVFKYQELTNDGIPRFAAFDRERTDMVIQFEFPSQYSGRHGNKYLQISKPRTQKIIKRTW